MFVQNKRRKTRNVILVALGSVVLILVACIAGYNYSRATIKRQGQQQAEESMYPTLNIPIATPTPEATTLPEFPAMAVDVPTETPAEDTLLESAMLEIIYEYSLCGHTHTITVGEGLTGKTVDELQAEYDGCTVEEFSPQFARLRKVYEMYCPNHYILKSTESGLQILRTVAGKDELVVDRTIDAIGLPPDEALQNGIVFDSLEAIEQYLENIES